jgi:hypothetical protein
MGPWKRVMCYVCFDFLAGLMAFQATLLPLRRGLDLFLLFVAR